MKPNTDAIHRRGLVYDKSTTLECSVVHSWTSHEKSHSFLLHEMQSEVHS